LGFLLELLIGDFIRGLCKGVINGNFRRLQMGMITGYIVCVLLYGVLVGVFERGL